MNYNVLVILVIAVILIIITYKVAKSKFRFKGESEFNEMLTEILTESFSSNSLYSATQNIVKILQRYYKVDYVTVLILNNSNKLQTISSNIKSGYLKGIEEYCNRQLNNMDGSIVKLNISEDGVLDKMRGTKLSLFAPLIFKESLIGAILIEGNNVEKEKIREEIYGKIFKSTAMVLQNVINTEKLVTMLSTDQLTGVYNRRYLDNKLAEEIITHKNNGKTFNVVLLDIDHFKKVNDTYGHQFGDLVLQNVCRYVQNNIRKSNIGNRRNDWIARYGGEEFLIVFSDSNQKDIYNKVNQLRDGLSKLVMTDGELKVSITVSFGLATFPINGIDSEKLIDKADKALYESKDSGRNRVTIAK